MSERNENYMGIDLSTQSVSITVLGSKSLSVVLELSVSFNELAYPGTKNGVINEGNGVVRSPPLMWVLSLDVLFGRLQEKQFPFATVKAISVSGQQHGSVYWSKGAAEFLSNKITPSLPLYPQLERGAVFSVKNSPIWMDSSTTKYCHEIEEIIGGPDKVARLTGSRCFERFTVNQIAKIYRENPKEYNNTERISLVSSFLTSLLMMKYANIDAADGSGMNAMNITTKSWVPQILNYAAPNLASKLGAIDPSHSIQGNIATYFQKRYNFDSSCVIVAATGDNPSTLAGLRLSEGDIAVSLGTSTTVFGPLSNPVFSADEGNIMANPIDPTGYMAMICYKNGALAREDIRDKYTHHSWDHFSQYLRDSPEGNRGHIGFYFPEAEIIPKARGFYYFDEKDNLVEPWKDGKIHTRAIVESQALSMYLHAQKIGLKVTHSVLVTGGSSKNKEILQIISDVFGVTVYTGQQPNAASLGAALRAFHSVECHKAKKFVAFSSIAPADVNFKKAATPRKEYHELYKSMVERYRRLEGIVIDHNQSGSISSKL